MTKITKFKKVIANPANIQNLLKDKLSRTLIGITKGPEEITIESEGELTDKDIEALEQFFKYGLHSVWKHEGETE